MSEYGDWLVRDTALKLSELDQGIRSELSEIGTAMRKIIVSEKKMHDAFLRSASWQRWVYKLSPELASRLCFLCRSINSPFYQLNLNEFEKLEAETEIKFCADSVTALIQEMIEALNGPVLKAYLSDEYLRCVESLSGDFKGFRLEVAQLAKIPWISIHEADINEFINLRKRNPANGEDFLKLAAYLKMEGRNIDKQIQDDAERQRRLHEEEQRAAAQRLAEEISSTALSAALKGAGIDPLA